MPDRAQERLRHALGLLLGNLHYKVVGLLVALSAWLFVQGEEEVRDRVRATIDWITPADLVTTVELPSTVVLTVEGPRNAVRRAQRAEITVVADLSAEGLGDTTVDFSTLPVHGLPANLRIEGRSPSSVRFAFDQVAVRRLPIEVVVDGAPSPGHSLQRVDVDPPEVEVRGPRTVLGELRAIPSRPIDLREVAGTTTFPVDPDPPPAVQVIVEEQPVATVVVEPTIEERRLSNVPVVVRTTEPGWTTRPSHVTVRLEGPPVAIRGLTPEDVTVMVVRLPDNPQRKTFEASHGAEQGPRLVVLVRGEEGVRTRQIDPEVVEVLRP